MGITEFFKQAAQVEPVFEHSEEETGGSKRPTKVYLHAHHPETGDRMGTLTYFTPRRKADKILIDRLETEPEHRRQGVGSALMDEMQRRHPGTPIDHGDRTDAGKAWWDGYTNGKSVSKGRTMASATGFFAEAGKGKPRHNPSAPAAAPAQEQPEAAQGTSDPEPMKVRWHPAAERELGKLDQTSQKQIRDTVDRLSRGEQGLQTHPLTGRLSDWRSTKASRGHRVIHQPDEGGGLYIGYVGLHDYDKARNRLATLMDTERPTPESFAKREGEDWADHERRVRHGLSVGHLTYQQAGEHARYYGGGDEDPTSWDNKRVGGGWQHLPHDLYHTTTDVSGVMAHGLKSGHELGQQNGHGLGGTPQWLSMTDRADHAQTMLHAMHEYHDVLNGKTSLRDLQSAAARGEGAKQPYEKSFLDAYGNDEHHREATLDEHVIEPGLRSHEQAAEEGLKPHPVLHRNFGEGKDGKHYGTGWIRPMTDDEKLYKRHEAYGAFSRARDWTGGGPKSVLFISNDRKAFAAKDPSNFGVVKVRPRPGAQGFPKNGEHEWRTGTGDAVEVHGEPLRRTMARIGQVVRPFERTAAMRDGDDIPSRLLNPHGHHVKVRTEGYDNVEMVPVHHLRQYATQPTTAEHAKEVGHHTANSGEMTPLILHYHPASGEAYLGEGNHRLRGAGPLGMDHLPVRVNRAAYGLPGEGHPTPRRHPAQETGGHVPFDMKPSDLGIPTVESRPRTASFETPVPDNHEPYQHHHDWLPPREHFFAPTRDGLDPRLFDGDRIRPEVRYYLLGLLNHFWEPKYGPDWQAWARVYLAGSEASHFYGNDDLDVLIGVDYDAARHQADALTGLTDREIDKKLTDELREGLNDDHRMLPGPHGETGPYESTFYVNPDSWSLKALKPYAAYDLTNDQWEVRPVVTPKDFSAHSLPEADWDRLDALRQRIKEIATLPAAERNAQGAALYDQLHSERHDAFGPEGTGLFDERNIVWKALDKAPGHPLQQLIDWKHAHDGAGTDNEEAA